MINGKAAILIVNGNSGTTALPWLPFCVDKVLSHTVWPDYHIYIWNSEVDNDWAHDFAVETHNATTFIGTPELAASQLGSETELLDYAHETDPRTALARLSQRNHSIPLQRLREAAVCDGAEFLISLDTDAHPIKRGWLTQLISALSDKVVISGIWRDEMPEGIKPYVHPSCLCTTTEFVEANNLRFDFFSSSNKRKDTLSFLTESAFELGFDVHRLTRSNRNQLHWLIGGIYGDLVYHQGGGSRSISTFRGKRSRRHNSRRTNERAKTKAIELLFNHYDRYIGWLRGLPEMEIQTGSDSIEG